jgi:hypothetical protein
MKARGCFSRADYRARLSPRPLGWFARLKAATIASFPDILFNALASAAAVCLFPGAKGVRLELRQSAYDFRRRWFGGTQRT